MIDTLYMGRIDNGTGHIVYKLNIKAVISIKDSDHPDTSKYY